MLNSYLDNTSITGESLKDLAALKKLNSSQLAGDKTERGEFEVHRSPVEFAYSQSARNDHH